MSVDELFEAEPYLYDLIYDSGSMVEDIEIIKSEVEDKPYETIYGLVQTIKDLERELGWR